MGTGITRLQRKGLAASTITFCGWQRQKLGPDLPDSQAKVWEKGSGTFPCLALLFDSGQVLCCLWAHFLTSTMRPPGSQFSHSWTNNPLTLSCLNSLPLYFSSFFNFLNNRMGKTRDRFKKIRDIKGKFQAKMGSIKDRNCMDLTEAEDTKKR